ncbi:ethanolamine utilization protein EutJ [Thauera linaloolentis]|uniref:Ethanolamine utilization protein EutJ n=1 Tax=Thauera linaloolentis (strain DSM 12138 / JCM 21573 / CCUG 41526 / CIP 105981 / IAM 15112 / NBRC 102519 / 47Lol) TaxID=1123367 RepID=N6YF07_THAL4|nr:ethanolamine utilization protein EutJ [Thauera linaloolentis]ENO90115.1 ethanolamine utilization protein EutJ [Thauera linaloolentis 47Lol = DSM 12138]MCM8564747.1 ethanolamine utilization protein EutJ [Thauera linaloolentis]
MRSIDDWLEPRLARAAALAASGEMVADAANGAAPGTGLHLGIDLGTSDVVSMVLDAQGNPVAVRLDWADVVRDGVVWDFFGAVQIVRRQIESLAAQLGERLPRRAATSYPPGTDPRISVNVIEAAELEVSGVIDEPSAVAALLQLDRAAVVDIGGGTTGVAVVQQGRIVYSGDEPTGGHHVTLTLAGARNLPLTEAEALKRRADNAALWPVVRPVFDKMAHIVDTHLQGQQVDTLYLSGGSCSMPGVRDLFAQVFPHLQVILPRPPLFLTPLAIAAHGLPGARPQAET